MQNGKRDAVLVVMQGQCQKQALDTNHNSKGGLESWMKAMTLLVNLLVGGQINVLVNLSIGWPLGLVMT